jgi:hypothetical protein
VQEYSFVVERDAKNSKKYQNQKHSYAECVGMAVNPEKFEFKIPANFLATFCDL